MKKISFLFSCEKTRKVKFDLSFYFLTITLSLNTFNFDDRLKLQFCVDSQYNKIKNKISILLLIPFFRVQNNLILSEKNFYYYMTLDAFCHFVFAKNYIL